jgi:hypothetical protein
MLVASLRLGHDEDLPVPGQLAEELRLLAGNIDRCLLRIRVVVQVEDLVSEALQRSLGNRHQLDRQVQTGQPRGGRHDLGDMLQVTTNLGTSADPAYRGYQPNRCVRVDHRRPLLSFEGVDGAPQNRADPAPLTRLPAAGGTRDPPPREDRRRRPTTTSAS